MPDLTPLLPFYEELFGADRWPQILEGLKAPTRYSLLINKYANMAYTLEILKGIDPPLTQIPSLKATCLESEALEPRPFPSPPKDESNLKLYYPLDAASVLVAEALDVQAEDDVLDMCAAPGGKSLAILQKLDPSSVLGTLQLNEPNESRRKRLRIVIDEYIPAKLISQKIRFTGCDASMFGAFPEESFDRILVDAPCSSERHLLQNDEHGSWTPAKSKTLAKKQVSMLLNALRALRPGGRVVYATCSLSPLENDGVIAKVLEKTKVSVTVSRRNWAFGEPTRFGWAILPEKGRCAWGPIYFALLNRA